MHETVQTSRRKLSKDPRTKAIVTHAQEQTSLVSVWIEEMQ
jgi:hypothetical protein